MDEVKPEVTPETVVAQEKAQETAKEAPKEDIEQINWRQFRAKREEERKEAEASKQLAEQKQKEADALKKAMEALLSKPAPMQQDNSGDMGEESEDDRIEKKVQAALAKKEAEYQQRRAQEEAASMPSRLAQQHPDFNQVCTTENVDYLEYHYPEVASAIKHMPEGLDKWSTIYKAVKRFVPNPDTSRDDKRIAKNLSKPQSPSAMSTGTGDQAPRILDDTKRAANWERMRRVMKTGG
jgi:hypothetical protein